MAYRKDNFKTSHEYRAMVEQENAKKQASDVDAYGFKRSAEFNYVLYQEIMNEYMPVLTRRAIRWKDLMSNAKSHVAHSNQIKRFCRKGIPTEHRSRVWMDLSGAQSKMQNKPNLYNQLLHQNPTPENEQRIREMEMQIGIDLDRTFPDNIYFNGTMTKQDRKMQLSNVLKAHGRRNPDIGYCQGLNYLVGILLLITNNEEKSFWLLTTLLDDIIPCYYERSMHQTQAELEVLSELVQERCPEVAAKMNEEMKPWMVIASKWFICLFIDVLPIETVLRVWDCMFCEGSKILIRTALYLVMMKTDELKKARGLMELKSAFDKLDQNAEVLACHSFIENMLRKTNPMSSSKLQRLREKHLQIIKQNQNCRT